ncbi:Ribonuclease 3 [Escovopsis weberi]|uniref:Ribonuclease 3 n=1 Tax=Escovopsis weberi TaxID=150374 RepID=A0A0M9VV39_ESCWE|nr:Ribonuclease 3 [Escovopsis weberi]
MFKRSGTEVFDDSSSKRHKVRGPHGNDTSRPDAIGESTQALLRIAEKADELVECLQTLKKQFSQDQAHPGTRLSQTRSSLSRLCKNILPSVELLSALDDSNPTATEQALAVGEKAPRTGMSTSTGRSPKGSPIPSAVSVTPWALSDLRPGRPELPKILDPGLAEEAFTHPGMGLVFSYERLEWLGDAYLELISSALIHETFGQLPSGRCSQLRERLIRNVTLAEYFRHYGMQKWAKLPGDFSDGRGPGRGKSSDKDLLKTQADMFEAYVAAVVLSDPRDGLSTVVAWLKALWGKTIEEDIRKAEHLGRTSSAVAAAAEAAAGAKKSSAEAAPAQAAAPKSSAKEQLAQRIVVKGIAIRYKDLPCEKKDKNLKLPLYSIGLYLDGWGEQDRLLAVGTALSKKEAGQKAAETLLQNRKQMKVYEEKKRAYMQARAEAEAAQQ